MTLTETLVQAPLHTALDAFHDPCVITTSPRTRPSELDPELPFELWRWVPIDRDRGVQFAEATGDRNPLHAAQDVVPGAFLVAECVAALEVLLPQVRLDRLKFSFSRISRYGLDLEFLLRGTPRPGGGLRVSCSVAQCGTPVAEGQLEGELRLRAPGASAPRSSRGAPWLPRVLSTCDALGVDPEVYLQQTGRCFPLSLLCALPSGRLVEELGGEGGLLNRLTLELTDVRLPLSESPRVEVQVPAHARPSFNRIGLTLRGGGETLGRGRALVLPGPQPLALGRAG